MVVVGLNVVVVVVWSTITNWKSLTSQGIVVQSGQSGLNILNVFFNKIKDLTLFMILNFYQQKKLYR